mmetsp:Transcript_27247/g.69258  ORF Transcript_27247/g.69258 Transcript_27247/m.69258 type:complete len:225 (-) Transcript_27247:671-1345(-)
MGSGAAQHVEIQRPTYRVDRVAKWIEFHRAAQWHVETGISVVAKSIGQRERHEVQHRLLCLPPCRRLWCAERVVCRRCEQGANGACDDAPLWVGRWACKWQAGSLVNICSRAQEGAPHVSKVRRVQLHPLPAASEGAWVIVVVHVGPVAGNRGPARTCRVGTEVWRVGRWCGYRANIDQLALVPSKPRPAAWARWPMRLIDGKVEARRVAEFDPSSRRVEEHTP